MNIFKRAIDKFEREWKRFNIFCFLPISKKIVLFESTSDFCDNSKALYDEMLKLGLDKKYKLIWFVDNVDYYRKLNFSNTKFYKLSIGKISFKDKIIYWYYNSRAKYCFYIHKLLGTYPKKKQFRVFLTHGIPLKDSRGKFWDVKKTHILFRLLILLLI